jgi:hypothetical protein
LRVQEALSYSRCEGRLSSWGWGGWSFSGNLRIFFDQEMAEQEKMQALVRSREKKLLLVANKYHLCGFDDQASASGPGQWRGLEIGSCEEEAASSAACQIKGVGGHHPAAAAAAVVSSSGVRRT